jgi:hypothetical protein
MTPKQREENDKRRDAGQARMKRLFKEDLEFKRSGTDPEFTTIELARILDMPERTMRDMLVKAGIGNIAIRPGPNGGRAVKTRVVRWSALQKLAKEMGWWE